MSLFIVCSEDETSHLPCRDVRWGADTFDDDGEPSIADSLDVRCAAGIVGLGRLSGTGGEGGG